MFTSPTVYGIETEYTMMLTLPGDITHELVGACHARDADHELFREPAERGIDAISHSKMNDALESIGLFRNSHGMLSNGGRLYVDPSGPEYATPEVTTAAEAVERSFDGDRIMSGVFTWLQRHDIVQSFQINRRIVDHTRVSRGIHLNTTTNLDNLQLNQARNHIATLNVAKGALFGSGGLLLNRAGETEYHHSPRLSLTNAFSASYLDYIRRPLVRTPLKPDGVTGLNRLETVSGDALNFAWPLRASMVTTNALVNLLELGYLDCLPALAAPQEAALSVGRDGNTAHLNVVRDGQFFVERPNDVMRSICEIILKIASKDARLALDEETNQVLTEVIDVADQHTHDPLSVIDTVESEARKVYLNEKMSRHSADIDDEIICRADYLWDWVSGYGYAERLRDGEQAWGWRGFDRTQALSPAERKRRIKLPPQDTRAKLRGNLVLRAEGNENSDWDSLDVNTEHKIPVHPLATVIETN